MFVNGDVGLAAFGMLCVKQLYCCRETNASRAALRSTGKNRYLPEQFSGRWRWLFFVSSPYQAPCRLYEQKQMVGTRTFNSNSLFLLPARGARWAVIKIEIPFLEPRRASGNAQLQGCPILTGSAQHGGFFGPTGVVLWLLSRTLTENPSGSFKVASWPLIACVRHQNTTRLGAFTHRAKTRQARYEVEGQFLPMGNLGN